MRRPAGRGCEVLHVASVSRASPALHEPARNACGREKTCEHGINSPRVARRFAPDMRYAPPRASRTGSADSEIPSATFVGSNASSASPSSSSGARRVSSRCSGRHVLALALPQRGGVVERVAVAGELDVEREAHGARRRGASPGPRAGSRGCAGARRAPPAARGRPPAPSASAPSGSRRRRRSGRRRGPRDRRRSRSSPAGARSARSRSRARRTGASRGSRAGACARSRRDPRVRARSRPDG